MIDFDRVAKQLLSQSSYYLTRWLPGGKLIGREYTCGSLRGESGTSCKVNVDTGQWADFATNDKGKDLISLYAVINGIKNGDAAKQLAETLGLMPSVAPKASVPEKFLIPPNNTPVPEMRHQRHGKPSKVWSYRDADERLLFFVCRYDTPNGKQFCPWSYSDEHKWVPKSWPEPRPLYGLELLAKYPDRAVLITEGEKSADAARALVGSAYVVVTWPSGAKAFQKADWRPVYGRRLLIWPDADQPGREAMALLMKQLYPHCPEIKVLMVDGKSDGWDAADYNINDDGPWRDWAKGVVKQTKPALEPVVVQGSTVERIDPVSRSPGPTGAPNVLHTSTELPPSTSHAAAYDKLGLALSANGNPVTNVDNVFRILQGVEAFKDLVWYDEFHFKVFTKWKTGLIREWSEQDDTGFNIILQRELGMGQLKTHVVREAMVYFAYQNIRNEPRDWMNGLVWDQSPRIDNFMTDCLGSEDTEYSKAVSKNFWLAMVARILKPGCKFDNMIILEGSQGAFKSTALDEIAGGWFVATNESLSGKDFLMSMHGALILEIAELDSFSKAEVTTVKKVVSTRVDKFRPPYGGVTRTFPRQCIFVGTTNKDDYLTDETGNRRFWPIKVGSIDLRLIKEHREQMFAEAVHRFKAGESWWNVPEEEARAQQEMRRDVDPWHDTLEKWALGKPEITLVDAWDQLDGDISRLDRAIKNRLGKIFRAIGYENKVVKIDGKTYKRWSKGYLTQPGLPIFAVSQTPKPRNYAPGADNSHLDN